MALIIDAGGTGATGTHLTTGVTQVVASGAFGSASVQLMVEQDGAAAPVYTFSAPGAVAVQTVNGATITATVTGGQSPAIDVSANP